MKNKTYYTIRSQALLHKKTFYDESDAINFAEKLCENSGQEVAVVLHVGDTSRLIKKMSMGYKATA
jgi:hypothetical protein